MVMRAFFLLIGLFLSQLVPLEAQTSSSARAGGGGARKANETAAQAEAASALLVPDQDKAREIGERSYNTWRVAMMRANATGWLSVTSV